MVHARRWDAHVLLRQWDLHPARSRRHVPRLRVPESSAGSGGVRDEADDVARIGAALIHALVGAVVMSAQAWADLIALVVAAVVFVMGGPWP